MRVLFSGYLSCLILGMGLGVATAQQAKVAPTQLTIYNGDFAVARTTIPLTLKAGMNEVVTTDVTSQLEADSVVLRDPESRTPIQVLEQNYDNGVVNQAWLLEKFEGQTIDFQLPAPVGGNGVGAIVSGRVIRAGNDPLIEVNGKMQFQLPGVPLFPVRTEGLLLKPTLRWQIEAKKAASFAAELDYITHGMGWQATYNVIIPEAPEGASGSEEKADVMGWVTINNNSGTEFPAATIQLMAGDVAKVQQMRPMAMMALSRGVVADKFAAPEVTQKAFDEFHLYDLHRTVALRNGETKQVQFLEASGVTVQRRYEFDNGDTGDTPAHVAVAEKIKNAKANQLGMPIPAGRLRVYRRDTDGQVQFVGESMIEHTPADQEISIVTGRAFDLTGLKRQTDARASSKSSDESYEVKLSNQKAQPVTIHVIEHMNRENWKITAKSGEFTKKDASTLDFPVTVPAKGDAVLTYSVHYSW